MGSVAASLSAADVRKTWHCRKEICSLCTFKTFPFWNSKHPLPTKSLRLLRAAVGSTSSAILCLHHFDPFVAAAGKARLMQRSRGFGNGVAVSKICYNAVIVLSVVLCDCCKPKNSCRDWAFSNSGLEVGLPPFSFPCSQNLKHCRKEIYSTCLFKTSIPAVPFWNSKHPVSTRSRFLRATVRSTSSALCLHHAHPFVVSAEKQTRFMQRSKAKRLVKQLWSPRFVTMQWLCSQLCFVTAANQRTVVVIDLLATVGWKWGCQPFSCPCSQNVTHCRKETCWTCLSKESIPATPFWISKHPLPARSRFLRATVGSTSSALCLHHAHPFVSAQKQRVWSQSCGLHDLLQCSDCALSCALWLLQTNEQLSRLIF